MLNVPRWIAVAALVLAACGGRSGTADGVTPNLLRGREPMDSRGVGDTSRLTDGSAAARADHWQSKLTSQFTSEHSYVIYDLGKNTPIASLWLQGDNNDDYIVELSSDGRSFATIWTAGPARGAGLQDRSIKDLGVRGRYLRVKATGGDRSYALSEIQAFSKTPATFPPYVPRMRGFRADVEMRTQIILFGLSMVMFVLVTYRRARFWWIALSFVAPLVTGFYAASSVIDAMPVDQRTVSLVRGMIGVVAALTIAREAFAPPRFLAHRGALLANLACCGVLGLLTFYNLGSPQFWDHDLKRPTFVHHLDLRQYYATAKYFPEIGYRGLYAADVAALLDDEPARSIESMANQNMRDLGNHQVSTVAVQRDRILAIEKRFSPERWEAYKFDQRYFRNAMSLPRYLEFMNDLDGNATPVWITIGYVMFNLVDATDASFQLTGLADPILVLAALLAIGLVFGPRTAAVCMVMFGANDLIMFFSNWGGATLRHDWMAYLAFGACALRREKWTLGGFFLAMATLIRAFPALSLLALGIPLFWQVVESLWLTRKLPTRADVLSQQRWMMQVALAAIVTSLIAVVVSSAILGANAWPEWYAKVSQLTADPHANHISLKSLIAGFEFDQKLVLRSRWPVFAVSCVFYVAAVAIGARGRRPEQIAMLGMVLLPVLFYPANYYIHFMWVLPLIVIEDPSNRERPVQTRDAWVWMCLLLLCGAQYWTTLVPDQPLHFYLGSVLLFAALTVMLVVYASPQPDITRANSPLQSLEQGQG